MAGHTVFPSSAVYSATKYAVKALSEGLRQKGNGEIRSTNISPGPVATELTSKINDPDTAKEVDEMYKVAITYAIEQPADVDVNEIMIRPTKQPL